MKKFLLKPGFELIFSLSLMIILGLPPVLLAQTQKEVDIRIQNGDTTINGQNIKNLSATDRQNALSDISHLNIAEKNDNMHRKYSFRRKDSVGGDVTAMGFKRKWQANGDHKPYIMNDSTNTTAEIRIFKRKDVDVNRFNEDMRDRMPRGGDRGFVNPMRKFDHRNSQNFDYMNTDKDGISTHISYRVSEVSNDDLKRMPHVEGGKFEITDLNLVPQFSSGKTLLLFNLPSKTPATVRLHDSEGKLLWSEKSTGGTFSKSFSMGLNGIYYLQVKQGSSIAVKRIMKEE